MTETLLKELLQKEYSIETWKSLLNEIFPNTNLFAKPEIKVENQENVKYVKHLGNIKIQGTSLGIFEVSVTDNIKIERNRVALRNLSIKYIDQDIINGALVFYFNTVEKIYRFTFIAKKSFLTEEGELKKFQTHPKRYTYVFGPGETNTTAVKRFMLLFGKSKNLLIDDLISVFSVEKLNKEFFKEYKYQYLRFSKKLIEEYAGDLTHKDLRNFVKLLLGRIVFLYFLQKKGWMGCPPEDEKWENGDREFFQNLFAKFSPKEKFHSKCLTTLFYNTLNNPNRPNYIFEFTGTRIFPLNGGLFEDHYPQLNDFDFPSDFFENLLEFFSQYNFTVNENDPEEHEIGIDPEMLGHIFENLLEENKDKGTFYTPKEIVYYMCQVSLVEYLTSKLDGHYIDEKIHNQIQDFVINGFTHIQKNPDGFVRKNARKIEDILDKIKICDPAIGSGAFPMGMLQEILRIKMNLDLTLESSTAKKDIIKSSIYGVDIDSGAIDIARLRFWLSIIVDEDNPHPLPNLDYKIIQGDSLKESFEGVDLSKVTTSGYQIKFVDSQTNLFNDRLKDGQTKVVFDDLTQAEISSLLNDYFYESRPEIKKELHRQIDKIVLDNIHLNLEAYKDELLIQIAEQRNQLKQKIKNLKNLKSKKDYVISAREEAKILKLKDEIKAVDKKFLKLKDLESKQERPYFLWNLYFKQVIEDGGFDIIIGNPPYGAKLSNEDKQLFKIEYSDVHMRTPDTFNYFISKSFRLLKQDGILTFIVPNNLLFQNENENTRKLLLQKQVRSVINLGDNTFENADVPTCIFVSKNNENIKDYLFEYRDFRKENIKKIDWYNHVVKMKNKDMVEIPGTVFGFSNVELNILKLIEEQSWKIDDIADEVASGISTGGDDIFRISKEQALELKLEKDLLHPVLVGGDIDKFVINYQEFLLIYSTKNSNTPTYTNIYNYLSPFKKKLSQKRETKKGTLPWYCLHWPRYPELFQDDKIIMRQTSDSIRACVDNKEYYVLNSIIILKFLDEYQSFYKYAAAILNSKMNNFLYKNLTQETNRTFAEVKPKNVRKLFIPKTTPDNRRLVEIIAEYLEFLYNKKSPKLSELVPNEFIAKQFEEILDGCIYELCFKEHMIEKQINILEDVRKLVEPLNFMSHAELSRDAVMKIFEKLRKPENKIKNKIDLFVTRSPELLKPIIQN